MPRIWTGFTVLVSSLAVLLLSTSAATQGRGGRREVEVVNGREAVAREVLVKLRESISASQQDQVVSSLDAESVEPLGGSGFIRIRSRSLNAAPLLSRLASNAAIAWAEPNFIVYALSDPTDPMFPQLWGLKNIGQAVNGGSPGLIGSDISVAEAWDTSVGSAANVVAVVDTGIDYMHPDLQSNMWSAPAPFVVTTGSGTVTCPAGTHGFNAIDKTCDPMDDHDHGTHVAGTIGARGNNGIGVAGVSWTAQLMGLKFLDSSGSGTIADAISAIDFAIQAKQAFTATGGANVRVLSNSWGGFESSFALRDQINLANSHDMLFVAAAGNYGISNDILPIYPASHDVANIVAVAATTNTDGRASFSNYGASSVDLGAPGVDIFSTIRGEAYGFMSGTSMATPHVSGAAALVLSQCSLDTAQLKDALLSSVDPVSSLAGKTTTGGRLNVHSALQSCIAPPATPAGLTASGGDAIVRLTWPRVAGAIDYSVKRSLSSSGPFALIASNVRGSEYIDSGLVNGTTYYYLIVARNLRGDSGDSNVASATPAVPGDLVISSVTAPSTAGAGTTIVVSVTTRNQGTGSSAPSMTGLYLSTNPTREATDLLLGSREVPMLVPGAVDTASLPVELPPATATGSYYVLAVADPNNAVVEGVETNNLKASAILKIGPDLIVSVLSAPGTAAPGATITVSDTTKNQGGGSAAAATTRFFLSANTVVDAADVVLGSRPSALLLPGGSESAITQLVIPDSAVGGSYYILAQADGGNTVVETSESNNVKVSSAVKIGPDLVVSSISVPTTAAAGDTIAANETTKNQGSAPSPGSATGFYLSTNSTISATDVFLGSRPVAPLDPNGTDAVSKQLQIPPATAPGTYYVIASADWDTVVLESAETNNFRASGAIKIGSDLILSALSVPAAAAPDTTINVTDTTKNQGSGVVPASATGFYLSTDLLLGSTDVLLGSRPVGALGAGLSETASAGLFIPANTAPGTYYIVGKADWNDAVAESTETNNSRAGVVVRIGPDLIVFGITAPSSTVAGTTITAGDTTRNQGASLAPASVTRFYLSTNLALDAMDVLLASRPVSPLAAGLSEIGSIPLPIPTSTAAGTYNIIAKADGGDTIAEAVENNNIRGKSILITVAPAP